MRRRSFLRAFGLAGAGLATGSGATAGLADLREHKTLMLSGHAVGVDRPADVVSTQVVYRVPTTKPWIALTFDDGPSSRYTESILDILDQHDAVATFNLIGRHALAYPELARRAAARHEIGNHTWSHPNMSLASARQAHDEMQRGADAIHRAAGVVPATYRPPYGYFSGATVMTAAGFGYPMVLWDLQISRKAHVTATENIDYIGRRSRAGSIILAHDGGNVPCHAIVDALPGVLDRLRERGFSFVTTSTLLAAQPTFTSPSV